MLVFSALNNFFVFSCLIHFDTIIVQLYMTQWEQADGGEMFCQVNLLLDHPHRLAFSSFQLKQQFTHSW